MHGSVWEGQSQLLSTSGCFLSLCSLEELFLCLNDYETVSCPSVCCHSLKLLHITDNNLQDWTEIRKLGVMFPSLDTLVLANNHVNAIEEPADSLARLFPNLRSISLHKSGEAQACPRSLSDCSSSWWTIVMMCFSHDCTRKGWVSRYLRPTEND